MNNGNSFMSANGLFAAQALRGRQQRRYGTSNANAGCRRRPFRPGRSRTTPAIAATLWRRADHEYVDRGTAVARIVPTLTSPPDRGATGGIWGRYGLRVPCDGELARGDDPSVTILDRATRTGADHNPETARLLVHTAVKHPPASGTPLRA